MKIIKRILLGLISIFLLIVIIGYVYHLTTKPSYSGELTFDGLQEPVEILYDEYAVPQNEDACYAFGYGHAQDWLFQMEMIHRAENGETVSPTGQSGNVMSAHYSDQARMFAIGKFRKMLMNRNEIKSKATTLILKPSLN